MKLKHTMISKAIFVLCIAMILTMAVAGPATRASATTTYKFINGVVTNTDGEPLAGIQVDFWRNDPYDPWNPDLWWHLAVMMTDVDGKFVFNLPAIYDGQFRLYFSDPAGNYVPEYYDDKTTFGEATIFWPVLYMKPENDRNAVLERVVIPPVPGAISGLVAGPDGALANAFVTAFQNNGVFWAVMGSAMTGTDGVYTISGLFAGLYRVYFFPPLDSGLSPEFFDDSKGTIDEATDVTVADGTTTPNIDASLEEPPPPVGNAQSGTGSTTVNPQNGQVVVTMPADNPSDLTVTTTPTCPEGSTVGDVVLVLTDLNNVSTEWPMSPTGNPGEYGVTVPAANLPSYADMTIDFTCNGEPQPPVNLGQVILYDPSGFVTDAISGQLLENVAVTLFNVPDWLPKAGPDDNSPNTCESVLSRDHDGDGNPDPDDPWDQPAPTDIGTVAFPLVTPYLPELNPLVTGADGHYGWIVSMGCWYVTASLEGYRPLISPVVGVPPEVTDLDLALTPTGLIYLPVMRR